jgi:hypothetical protein
MPGSSFRKGQLYTRAEVAERIDLPPALRHGGNWDTGYSRWNDEFFIFCNVGIPGKTGHDYPNRWEGKELLWTGKTRSRKDTPFVREMLSGARSVHLFWRGKLDTPFTYAGLAAADEVVDTIPVQVRWSFESAMLASKDGRAKPPVWRRGPPPSNGAQTIIKQDGPTQLYVMKLNGPAEAVLPACGENLIAVKVGMSNNPSRRVDELNCGFPPGSSVEWGLHHTRTYPSGREAFAAEGKLLEVLRLAGSWIGGEFAIVSHENLEALLAPGTAE